MRLQFLDVFYNTLFHPVQLYRAIGHEEVEGKDRLVFYGVIIVALASSGAAVAMPAASSVTWLLFQVIMAALCGLMVWLFTAMTFATAAYVFGNRGQPQVFLILSAFATLPCLFLPVIMQFKEPLGSVGNVLGFFGSLVVWIWSLGLFLMAIKFAYRMTVTRVMLALLLPVTMTLLGLVWTSNVLYNLFAVVR